MKARPPTLFPGLFPLKLGEVARPQPLNNFSGGCQICNDEYKSKNSKNVDFDCIMNGFFDERKNGIYTSGIIKERYYIYIQLVWQNFQHLHDVYTKASQAKLQQTLHYIKTYTTPKNHLSS